MVNVQTWLDRNYPRNLRQAVSTLNINKELNTPIWEKPEGYLDLRDFVNLEKLDCSHNLITGINLGLNNKLKELNCGWNRLTSLNVGGLNNLEFLYCNDNYNELTTLQLPTNKERLKEIFIGLNNLPNQNLTCFREFINLEVLSIGGNPFFGSLEPLKNLTKLKQLNINNTNIDSGLEYLPNSVEIFSCGCYEFSYRQASVGVMKIWKQLEFFKIDRWGKCDLQGWRRNSLIELIKEKKELESKLAKQKEISRQVIEQLKGENNQFKEQIVKEKRYNNELRDKYLSQEQLIKQYLQHQEKEVKELGESLAQIQIPPR